MVKGISKQVIVVNSPDRQLFEQAIFILSDDAVKNNGFSNERLLAEANKLLRDKRQKQISHGFWQFGLFALGSVITAAVWILSSFL